MILSDCRAQSETLGIILLVSIVVLSVGIFATFYLGTIGAQSGSLVDAKFSADGGDLTITHAGGDPVSPDELLVGVDRPGDRTQHAFADGSIDRGTDDRFAPGDRWRFDVLDPDGAATVWLIHEPSDRVLDRDRVHPD